MDLLVAFWGYNVFWVELTKGVKKKIEVQKQNHVLEKSKKFYKIRAVDEGFKAAKRRHKRSIPFFFL